MIDFFFEPLSKWNLLIFLVNIFMWGGYTLIEITAKRGYTIFGVASLACFAFFVIKVICSFIPASYFG